MVSAVITFVLLILFYMVISHAITILFRLTGMTEEKARFQVVSLLTNSGYTTQESEMVVKSRVRRRLALGTMLFGYVFSVTILSAIVNIFMEMKTSDLSSILASMPILLSFLLIYFFVRKATFFYTKFDDWVERLGNRYMYGRCANEVWYVEEYGGKAIAHICLHKLPHFLRNVPLAESGLMTEHHVTVIMVKHQDEEPMNADGEMVLREDDIIMVLGSRKDIRKVFE